MGLLKLSQTKPSVLQDLLLPLLRAADLCALATSCKALKHLVYDCSGLIWKAAARQYLPEQHPLAKPYTRENIQAQLQAFSDVQSNIAAGSFTYQQASRIRSVKFNATGSHLAVTEDTTSAGKSAKIYDMRFNCIVSIEAQPQVDQLKLWWGSEGTSGVLAVWFQDKRVALFFGDLTLTCQSPQGNPWDTLRRLDVPEALTSFDHLHINPSPNLSKALILCQSRWQHDEVHGNIQPRLYVVLDTCSGTGLWQKALDSDQQYLRGCETVQWAPDGRTLFFGMWELRNDQLQTELPSPPPRVCTVTIGETPPGQWKVWYEAASNQALTQILCSPVSREDMWIGVLSVDESDAARLQAVVLHWPSGQLHWWENDLSQACLWWDGSGQQFSYFKEDTAERHRCRLCVMKLASQLGLDDAACSWTARLSASRHQLNGLLGPWPHSPFLLSATMCFSPTGQFLALAARYDRAASEKQGRSAQEQAIIVVDTSRPDMPVVAGLDVGQHDLFEVLEMEWSADSATICALCQCYRIAPAGNHDDYADTAVSSRQEKIVILFSFNG